MAIETGRITINETAIIELDSSPLTGGGFDSPLGSICVDKLTGILYRKNTVSPTGWEPYLTLSFGNSSYQPLDADLTAIAAQTGAGFLVRTSTNTWATRSLATGGSSGIGITNQDGVFGSPVFSNTDRGSVAVASHVSEVDPHPQYETSVEAQAKVDAHANLTNNPHAVTAAQVGLSNVNNTSDLDKPISTATQNALNLKYDNSNPAGYETPAQLNARDTANRARSNHTGVQAISTITGLQTVLDGKANLIGGNIFTGNQRVEAPTVTLFNGANPALVIAASGGAGNTASLEFKPFEARTGGSSSIIRTEDNNFSSDLLFLNAESGASSNTAIERMRLNTGGQLLLGTSTAVPSAKVQIDSTTQGFLPPRMTSGQRTSILNPAAGLVVYDTTVNNLYQFNGNEWTAWTVFGTEFQFFEDSVLSTTTSTAQPLTAVATSFTTNSVPLGVYRINLQYYWTNNSVISDSRFSLFVDNVQIGLQHNEEQRDSTTNRYSQILGFVTFGSVGTHTIQLRFGSESGITTTVSRVNCEFWRVS